MTLQEITTIGEYNGFCFREIVADLGLRGEFEAITGTPLDDYDFDPSETNEEELIREVLNAAPNTYMLYSTVVGRDEHMHYAVLEPGN